MITRLLIALNFIGFVFEIATNGMSALTGTSMPLVGLVNDGALVPSLVLQNGEYWRIVSGAFLHIGAIHIAVNMYSLWILGRFVEQIAGRSRMLAIYFVALIASGFAVVYFAPPDTVTAGASGAIFGLFGALFAIGFKLPRGGMELIKSNIGILVLNLVISFAVPGISWQAHIGGLIAGFIVTYLIYAPPKPVYATVVDQATGAHIESEVQ